MAPKYDKGKHVFRHLKPEKFAKPHVSTAQVLKHQEQQKAKGNNKGRGILMERFKASNNVLVSGYIRASRYVDEVAFEDRVYDVTFEQLKNLAEVDNRWFLLACSLIWWLKLLGAF